MPPGGTPRFKESFSRASIRLATLPEGRAVIKDFSGRGPLFRLLVGPFLLDREERAYRALEGIEGIPRVLRRLHRQALALEWIEGEPLGGALRGKLDQGFFLRLEATIRAMHARGVVHLDLQQKRNVLVTPDRRPYLVDFASSMRLGRGIARRILLPPLARIDLAAVVKFKERYAPGLLTTGERARAARRRLLARLWPARPWNDWKKRRARRRRAGTGRP